MISAAVPHWKSPRDLAYDVAAFGVGLRLDRLPATVVEAAKTNVRDTLACAAAGRTAPGVGSLLSLVNDWGGKPEATIFGSSARYPAHHAAWVNGVMAHARDFDDTHDAAVLHAGISVLPATLAAAELAGPGASGADILAGIVAGLELTCRLGVATSIGIIESGFIYSALLGCFGATLAASRVMGFDEEQTVNALGIALSQAAGTHQVTRDAAMTKRMQPGFAAKAALVSVRMTQVGIRGARNVFEGEDGLFRTYLRGRADGDRVRSGLGESFEFLNLSYKPYPCCRFTHTAIDAALEIRTNPSFDVRRGGEIVVRVNKQAYEAVCTPIAVRRRPQEVVQAQFSIPYTVACALVDGSVGIEHFTADVLARPDLLEVSGRVVCIADEEIERGWGRSISPALLTVDIEGRALEVLAERPRGHFLSPMTADDFQHKLRDCLAAGRVEKVDAAARALNEAIDGLAEAGDGSSLLRAMAG